MRIIPEGFAHPALDEVAKNNDRSVPTAFKSYHIGSTVPTQLAKSLNEQKVKPYNIFHNQVFKYTPKFMYKVLSSAYYVNKPRSLWFPIGTNVTVINGPIDNYNDHDILKLVNLGHSIEQNGCLIIGFERAPSTGTPHIQRYIRFSTSRHFDSVKLLLPSNFHFEQAKGTETTNKRYCSKSGSFQELKKKLFFNLLNQRLVAV